MGASGSGKTTLAKQIEFLYPDMYRKAIQVTTRKKRDNEVEGKDYYFLTDDQYDDMNLNLELTAQVKEELLPHRHGTPKKELQKDKINIVVASIEGFLDSLGKVNYNDNLNVLFITDVEPEVERELREYKHEEKYNKVVLHTIGSIYPSQINIVEITHEHLKKIRNHKQAIKNFLKDNKL
jgi:guanylate kinase